MRSLTCSIHRNQKNSKIVGYQTKDLVAGFNMITPSFTDVSASNYNIQDIKLSGEGITAAGTESIQIVDNDGNISNSYFWYTMDAMGMADGWYDENFEIVDVKLTPGQSFLLYTEGVGCVTVSGQVADKNIAIPAVAGFTAAGNATPINMSIQGISLSGSGITAAGTESIQIVDADGNISASYFWYTMDAMGMADGWYDENFELVEKDISAGEGFLLYTEGVGSLVVPSAL